MRTRRSNTLQASRLRPLAACLAIAISGDIFAGSSVGDSVATPIQPAAALRSARAEPWTGAASHTAFAKSAAEPDHPTATFVVKNCDDAGQDSLREAVGLATNGSAIEFDLNSMQCSTITLTSGQITIAVANLKIGGPDPEMVTIDGGYSFGHSNRIFNHTGNGTLQLDHLELTDAIYAPAADQYAAGGCVRSNGKAYLTSTNINSCRAAATGLGGASGGGVWARGITLVGSTVSNCAAVSESPSSQGGGIFTETQGFASKDSTISNNTATSYAPHPNGSGGGAFIRSAATFEHSTISGNQAQFGGGLFSTSSISLADSTITNNTGSRGFGGMLLGGNAGIYNSTIAFNTANEFGRIAGVRAASIYAVSSIIARNLDNYGGGGVASDVRSDDGQVSGSNNLIIAADTTTLPSDTLSSCPRLAPLFDNGGKTRTLALLPGSPAIDAGDDPFTLGTDQRGVGFPRVVGPFADIGAYEWSAGSGDIINRSGFETCE